MNPKEKQALYLYAHGLGTKQVADEMHITVSTVDKHLSSCRKKLGAKNTAEAIYRAVKAGFIMILVLSAPMIEEPRSSSRTASGARTRREQRV